MSGEIAHPLIVPLPRLVAPAGRALRWAALRQLRSTWAGGRLDLTLPSGECVRLGDEHGPADARARILDDRFFLRMMMRGEIGAGESFVAGEWTSDDLVGTLRVFLRGTRARGIESPLTKIAQLPALLRHRRSANTHVGSERNVHAHYDLGNPFYRTFLDDETLAYSAAYFVRAHHGDASAHRDDARGGIDLTMSLADAQRAKLERLCEWLELSPRDHLLEIGCGWGGMAIHAARTRGCRVTAITVSREQFELASARVAAAGLADRVSSEYRDYRTLATSGGSAFTKIVSIEMLEAVGYEYLAEYFAICARVLPRGGRFAVQTISMPDERFDAYRRRVDWMQTYIFPGTLIPSVAAIRAASAPAGLELVRVDDIGLHYAPTLRMWRERFVAALPKVRALGFDTPFIRTWLLYLAFSEAAFAERTLGDHQLLFTR
ncbi:MAG TPA: cyclopropane-fatty-acyl-phospholipid synthase family protein [Kofleriaceae bacterium]|nr:cyclopropane-fatty-acyl-phospholipid synthase family protein [Kofleriaceae bacterium]